MEATTNRCQYEWSYIDESETRVTKRCNCNATTENLKISKYGARERILLCDKHLDRVIERGAKIIYSNLL